MGGDWRFFPVALAVYVFLWWAAGWAIVHASRWLTMALSVSTFCPYEGEIPQAKVLGLVEQMHAWGVTDYSLATSVGVDGPVRIQRLVTALRERFADLTVSLHLHDKPGRAVAERRRAWFES